MRKFKVIKEFGSAKKGDIFIEDSNVAEVVVLEKVEENEFSKCNTIISMDVDSACDLIEEGYLIEVTDEDKEVSKLKEVEEFVDELIKSYTNDHDELMKEYEEGNVQPCVKVEAETVYCNLIKVLRAVKNKINE